MLFFDFYIYRWPHPNAAFIYKIAANTWWSDCNQIACIANGSIGVTYIAIRLGTKCHIFQASPSERKRSVFRSYLIANRALFDRARSPLYKMLICYQQVAIRSHRSPLERYWGVNWSQSYRWYPKITPKTMRSMALYQIAHIAIDRCLVEWGY